MGWCRLMTISRFSLLQNSRNVRSEEAFPQEQMSLTYTRQYRTYKKPVQAPLASYLRPSKVRKLSDSSLIQPRAVYTNQHIAAVSHHHATSCQPFPMRRDNTGASADMPNKIGNGNGRKNVYGVAWYRENHCRMVCEEGRS